MNELYEQFKQGDRRIWKQIYKEHYPNCKWPILKNGGTGEDAKSVFNKVVASLWEKLHDGDFESPNNLEAYLYNACRFEWYNQRRKAQRASIEPIEKAQDILYEDPIEDLLLIELQWSQIYDCMDHIKGECRELLILSFLIKEKHERPADKDIAEKFGWKYSYVRQRRYQCIQQVKKCVESNN